MPAPVPPKPRYATVEEVADVCRQSARIVQRWCIDSLVVAFKTPGGRLWRIQVDETGWPVQPEGEGDRAS